MIRLEPEILETLGLSGQTRAVVKDTIPAPVGHVGHGYASAALSDTLEGLVSTGVSGRPVFQSLDLPFVGTRVPEATVSRWQHDPALILIEMKGGEAIGGNHAFAPEPGILYLDSRHQKAFARLIGGRGQLVIGADRGAVSAFEVIEPLSPAMERLLAGGEPVSLHIELPGLEAWVGETEGWLSDIYTQLSASETPLSRLAAAGLVARLWSPPRGSDMKALIAQSLAGDGPAAKIGKWARDLGQPLLERAMRLAVVRADILREELTPLSDSIADDPDGATADARHWLVCRDNLQSVRAVLSLAIDTTELDRAIELLDREATLHHSMWSAVGDLGEEERLSAVAWQEPEHWWGALSPLGR